MKALLYLYSKQIKNSILSIFRSAKKLLAVIFIFSFIFMNIGVSAMVRGSKYGGPPVRFMPMTADTVWSGVFLIIVVFLARSIFASFKEGLLIFSPSHVDYLFPSPISRRSVLTFKLLGDYIMSFACICLIAFFFGASLYMQMRQPMFPSIWYAITAIWFLFIFIANLSHILRLITSVSSDRFTAARTAVKSIFILIAAGILVIAGIHYLNSGNMLASLSNAARSEVSKTIFAPIAWCVNVVVGPMFGVDYGSIGGQVMWLGMLALGSFAVLVGYTGKFYEPSLAISSRSARIREAAKGGNFAAVRIEAVKGKVKDKGCRTLLPPFGRGAGALIWKILIIKLRSNGWWLVLFLIAPPVAAALAVAFIKTDNISKYLPFVIPYATLLIAVNPGMQGQRNELKQVEIIKTIPDTPYKIVTCLVFTQWLFAVLFTLICAVSGGVIITAVDYYLLWLTTIATITGSFAFISGGAILAFLYPNTRDKLSMTIPGCLTFFMIMLLMVPSIIIGVIAVTTRCSLFWSGFFLIVINGLVGLLALHIAGLALKNADPNEA
ncbi:MAG: putative ABC exporter domain-containing protein [Armatimonadota bacterium]